MTNTTGDIDGDGYDRNGLVQGTTIDADEITRLRAENELLREYATAAGERATAAEAQLAAALDASPQDIRAMGWYVAAHNDYKLYGEPRTFWFFRKNGRCIKGDGLSDTKALNDVRAALAALGDAQ